MIAYTNLPGSSHFRQFRGTKAECEAWLDKQKLDFQVQNQGLWFNCYGPGTIISDRAARKIRYRDGSRVFLVDPQDGISLSEIF